MSTEDDTQRGDDGRKQRTKGTESAEKSDLHDTYGSRHSTLTRRAFVGGLSVVGLGAGVSGFSGTAEAAGEPVHFQYFHETWPTITNNLSKVANRGYDAVWIQAPQKSGLTWADQNGRNDPPLGYQPVDFTTFDSEFGTEAELQTLINEAHNQGLEVYVDCVMNHMAVGYDYDFPRFSYDDFHHDVGSIDDWNDDHQVEHGELLGLPDLAQYGSYSSDYVRGELMNYMEKIASFGADGYRYDAVKHVEEKYWSDYANPKADELGMKRIGEVFDGSVDYVQGYIDTGMDAFDYPLYYILKDVFSGGDVSRLQGAGVVAQDPWHARPFVQNHDEGAPSQYHLAHAFVLTSEGVPMIYNLYPNAILDDSEVNNMVWVKKTLTGGETYWRHADGDLGVYERYNNLLVGINNGGGSRTQSVYTSWTNTTLKDYSGTGGDITTDGNGWVDITVPAEGWVFYAPY
ncbi:alpha-amylase domain-containing protein [Haladaptatus cibarius]|uniref:alpha-amylase domain-containing protein n=1 Tax=Haladaptatus cibarius TaxID=453847 RepID=UPI0009FF3951|nr:alpha-amylase domain-containing protein [Haladaptatus cibarius]